MKSLFLLFFILFFSACEITINTEKDFSIKFKEKKPTEVYKKGHIYSKLGETEPFTGIGVVTLIKSIPHARTEYTIRNGILDGKFIHFNSNNEVYKEGFYKNGKLHGTIKDYYKYGSMDMNRVYSDLAIEEYQNGQRIKAKKYKTSNNKLLADMTFDKNGNANGWDVNAYNFDDFKTYKVTYKDGKKIKKEPFNQWN